MLRRFTVSLGLTAVLVAACGGGADTSNPVAFCNAYAPAFCNKAQACGAQGDASACANQIRNDVDCPHFACAAGRTFDSEAASQCIDAINGMSCADVPNGVPNVPTIAVCARVCR
jgi:hypothetical protein